MIPPDLRAGDEATTKLSLLFGKSCGKSNMQAVMIQESIQAFLEDRAPREIWFSVVSVDIDPREG